MCIDFDTTKDIIKFIWDIYVLVGSTYGIITFTESIYNQDINIYYIIISCTAVGIFIIKEIFSRICKCNKKNENDNNV